MCNMSTCGFAIIITIVWIIPIVCLIRTNRVSSIRQQLLRDDYLLYKQLPSYETMMFQYRYWTISQYVKKYSNVSSNSSIEECRMKDLENSRKMKVEDIIALLMVLPFALILLCILLAVAFGWVK